MRERLAQRFFEAAGCVVVRETFARGESKNTRRDSLLIESKVHINGTNLGLFVLQEQIDEDFFLDRGFAFSQSRTSLWKMGDRKNDNMDSPKTEFSNSSIGRQFFFDSRQKG